ncbi:MAG: site-specific integrase [Lachnospiraceae bacterium]|nr:site-specific integrase [Lachnospiraceae bacterium]
MDKEYLLSLALKSGEITNEEMERAAISGMELELMEKEIQIPVISSRQRGQIVQFYITVPARLSRTGKRYQIVGRSEKEVREAFIREVYDNLTASIQSRQLEKMTVADGIEMYLNYVKPHDGGTKGKLKNSTISRYYRIYITNIKDTEFGNVRLVDLRLYHCEDFIQSLYDTGIVAQSIRGIKSFISQALNHLEAHDLAVKNYMKTVKVNPALCSPKNKRETGIWEDEEVKKIEAASKEFWEHGRYRYSAVYLVLLYTGCRIGEILAATWDDVDFVNRRLIIDKTYSEYYNYDTGKKCRESDTTKNTYSTRTVALPDRAIKWLKELKCRNVSCGISSNFVVVTKKGSVPTQSALGVSFRRFCKEAGVPYRSSHTCRRTDTTTLLDAGVPLAEVSQRLGHSKVSTTLDSYYKSKNQNNDAYMAAINHAFEDAYGTTELDEAPEMQDESETTTQGQNPAPSKGKGNIIDFSDAVAVRRRKEKKQNLGNFVSTRQHP